MTLPFHHLWHFCQLSLWISSRKAAWRVTLAMAQWSAGPQHWSLTQLGHCHEQARRVCIADTHGRRGFFLSEPSLAVVMEQSLVPGWSVSVVIGDVGTSFAVLCDASNVFVIDSHAHEEHGGANLGWEHGLSVFATLSLLTWKWWMFMAFFSVSLCLLYVKQCLISKIVMTSYDKIVLCLVMLVTLLAMLCLDVI